MKRLPIGLRLTLSYLLIFAVVQGLFGLGMWFALRQDLYDIADDTLEGRIEDFQRFLQAQGKDKAFTKLQEEITETYVLEDSGDYLQIRDAEGNWIYRAKFLETNHFEIPTGADLQKPILESRTIGAKHFRFLTQSVGVYDHRFIVQTGVPIGDIRHTLSSFRQNLLFSALAILALGSMLGYWLSRKALAPVDAITRTARNINAANLSTRLEGLTTGDELQRLSDTLNEMLARIETAFQRVSQFTADASHELRTPISLIRTEAEIALRKSRDEGEYQESLHHILIEAERTSQMIEKLLSLARTDAGRESLDIRRMNLKETVQKVVSDWRNVVDEHHLSFQADISNHDFFVGGDRAALTRVFNILMDNAVKYTMAQGSISIQLVPKNGNVLFTIKDTGIGISEDDQLRIFERFYRADKARSRELGGAGLGLAIAKWIVEQHRGRIEVTSTLNEGSQFVLILPLHS